MTDGFRNYVGEEHFRRPEVELVDRANQLTLTAPEMTVLVGGMRVLGANFDDSQHGVFTDETGALTNDFFVNLLDMSTEWKKSDEGEYLYEGHDRETGELKWTATVGGPGLRFELAAPRAGRGLRQRRRQAEVRRGLRGGVGQGHEPGSLRARRHGSCRRSGVDGRDVIRFVIPIGDSGGRGTCFPRPPRVPEVSRNSIAVRHTASRVGRGVIFRIKPDTLD